MGQKIMNALRVWNLTQCYIHSTHIYYLRCSLSFETVNYLLEEVATKDKGKRLRELDMRWNTIGVDLDLVMRARRQLNLFKIHSGCQCCL